MIRKGQRVKVILNAKNAIRSKNPRIEKKGYIYDITQNFITVMYKMNGKDIYKDSFIKADLISKNIVIEVMNTNKQFKEITKEDLKNLKGEYLC